MEGLATTDPAAVAGAPRTLELRRGEASPAMLAKLKQIGRGFDAVFAGTMLGELMKPAIGAGLGGSGPGASIVEGILEQGLADHLGKAGGFGIGRMLEKSLGPLLGTEPVSIDELEKGEENGKHAPASAAREVEGNDAIRKAGAAADAVRAAALSADPAISLGGAR
jgi:Rod binding domain-containing protein